MTDNKSKAKKMSELKIGIYGGTFAPVHIGHIRAAYSFLTYCELDKLFIMPAFIPPHKSATTGDDPRQRLEMLKIAFSPLPYYDDRILISDYEIRQKGKSFTYLTLEHFSFISKDITLLVGTDNFLTLENWKNYREIFSLAKIAHAVRPENGEISKKIEETKERYEREYGATVIDVPMTPTEISSTEIRRLIKERKDTSRFLPYEVRDYIEYNHIYGGNGSEI